MGSIPEYQRKQFASTYVGGAQRDDTGALIAGAIQEEFVEPIRKREIEKLRAEGEAQTEAIADNALISYSLAAQEQMGQLEKDYAQNPQEYPNAVQKMLKELGDEMAKSLPDSRVRAKFLGATTTVRKQAIKPSFTWQQNQREANTLTAVEDSTRITALTATRATDIPAFQQNTGALKEKVNELARLRGVTDKNEIQKLYTEADEKVVEAFLWNVLDKNPDRMFDILASKEMEAHPGYTADMKGKFKVRANNKILKQKKDLVDAQKLVFENLTTEAIKRTLTFEQIDERVLSEDPLLSISTKQANNLRQMILPGIRTDATAVAKEYPIAEKYLKLVNSLVKDNITRAKFQQELAVVWRDGVVTPEEGPIWDTLVQGLTTLDGVRRHQQAAGQIKSIMSFAQETYKYLPKTEQTKAIATAVRSHMETWTEKLNQGSGYDTAVGETIARLQKARNPDRTMYKVGDIVPNSITGKQYKVVGYYADGEPNVEPVD